MSLKTVSKKIIDLFNSNSKEVKIQKIIFTIALIIASCIIFMSCAQDAAYQFIKKETTREKLRTYYDQLDEQDKKTVKKILKKVDEKSRK
jgi:flagellar biosynthesis/type III secretory pathway M-ring protein FliF/YscJ